MSALDSLLVGKYHSEYLTLIDRYKDLRRNSIFCRYYNVNENAALELNTITLNKFSVYDIYDYTPLFRIDTISDNAEDSHETSGLKFIAEFSLNTYTITTPRINDVIVFPYEANNKNLIYRVKSINASINSLTEAIKFTTLNLEYASITNINTLKIINHYVYLITEGKNVPKKFYIDFLSDMARIKELLKNSKFDENLEYYKDYSEQENILIFIFLNKFDIYFYNIKKPYLCLNRKLKESDSSKEIVKLINKYVNI